jgi:hypothetical protein
MGDGRVTDLAATRFGEETARKEVEGAKTKCSTSEGDTRVKGNGSLQTRARVAQSRFKGARQGCLADCFYSGRPFFPNRQCGATRLEEAGCVRWVIRDAGLPRRKLLNLHAPRQHRCPLHLVNPSSHPSNHISRHLSSRTKASSALLPFFPTTNPQPTSFKMTGGGKSGGKASGSKSASS